jgi:hypothetical protein
MQPFLLDESVVLHGATLVLPVVGAGNVGQLAAELMISSLFMKHVGYLESAHVYSLAGYLTNDDDTKAAAPLASNLDRMCFNATLLLNSLQINIISLTPFFISTSLRKRSSVGRVVTSASPGDCCLLTLLLIVPFLLTILLIMIILTIL